MKHSLIYTIDMIQVCGLAVFTLVCIIGAIANKAWWHIGTAAICTLLAWASWKDAQEEMRSTATIGNEGDIDLE